MGLCHGWWGRTLEEEEKTPPFDYFLHRVPGLLKNFSFLTVPLLMPGREIKEEATGLGVCGAEEGRGLAERETGGQRYLRPISTCFSLARLC